MKSFVLPRELDKSFCEKLLEADPELGETLKKHLQGAMPAIALDGHISIEEAADQVRQSSRRYAKRQLTWFRRNGSIHWLRRKPASTGEEILSRARQILHETDK